MIESQESITAKLCSFARAFHSNYDRNKIFDDYLAYDMMGKNEYERTGRLIEDDFILKERKNSYALNSANIRERLNTYIAPIPLSRIAYAENELQRFAWERGECQYVICGAGMDTFAFRNTDPNIRVFEIDHPDTQRYKLSRIRDLEWNIPDTVRFVAVDFSKDDMAEKLENAGFDKTKPSFFSILGVTYYLELAVFEETINKIYGLSSPGSKVVFDYPDEKIFLPEAEDRMKRLMAITEFLGESMLHGYTTEEIEEALERQGFIIDDHAAPSWIQKRFFDGRDGLKAYENIHFILAKKGERFNESYYLYI